MTTTSDTPRVSVGLPVYNRERYLGQAIDAHLAQTFGDFELIVCDNASTDGTERIGRDYAARDQRIRYVRNPQNIGASGNYRRCFELARAEYFKWAPSDDACAPELLARCVEVLDRDPSVVLAYGKTNLMDEHGQLISKYDDNLHLVSEHPSERFAEFFERVRLCNPLYGLIRASALRKTALLGSYVGADIPLLAELSLHGKFCEVPEHLFYRRLHPGASVSMKTDADILEFYDPRSRGKIPLTEWRQLLACQAAVWRAPISLGEKLRVQGFLLRRGIQSRGKLGLELYAALRYARRGS